ncbi:MAG: hypothetical protein KC636_18765 [Myxococcales bacterium]|nr:hypothetical protein [Myxococcales bacterium]
MKYPSFTRRILSTTLAALLTPSAFVGAAVLLAPQVAKAEPAKAECQLYSVHALRTGDGTIPDDLKFLESQLRGDDFAAFKSFKLLETKRLSLDLKAPVTTAAKSGHKLTLEYLGTERAKLKLRAKLLDRRGETSLLAADLLLVENGLVWLGGVTHGEGKLFFGLHCRGTEVKPG